MTERIVKFRLVTYFDEVPNQVTPQGENVLVERTASLGEKIALREADEKRLDSLGALYTEDEAKAIEEGKYQGVDAALLAASRGGVRPQGQIQPADGEGEASAMDAAELAQYIRENRLNIGETVALAGEDAESIQRVLDAENIATDNAPRAGVTEQLERRLAELED
jgi:hypothetical protein